MEMTRLLWVLWSKKLLLALGLILALALSILSAYHVSLSPPAIDARSVSYGAASTQVLIDTRRSSLASVNAVPADLSARAEILSQFLGSPQSREQIARAMGVPTDQISIASSPNTVQAEGSNAASIPQQAAKDAGGNALTVTYQVQLGTPVIAIYARGPNARVAVRLADAAATSLRDQITLIGDRSGVDTLSPERVIVRDIGEATGGDVSASVDRFRLALVFAAIFGAWCFLILFASWFRRDWKRVRESDHVAAKNETS